MSSTYVTVTTVDNLVRPAAKTTRVELVRGAEPITALIARALDVMGCPALDAERHAVVINDRGVEVADLGSVPASTVGRVLIGPRPAGIEIGVIAGLAAVGVIASFASAAFLTREHSAQLPPAVTSSSEPEESRPSFGRFSRRAFPGGTPPVIFGFVQRRGGDEIQTVRAPNPTGNGERVLRMLLCYGHGPIKSIGGITSDSDAVSLAGNQAIYLNDQPVSNFPGARAWVRLGTEGQAAIPGFDDAEVLRDVGAGAGFELVPGDTSTYTTIGAVDAVTLTVSLPQGLFEVGANNTLQTRRVEYRVRLRQHDTGSGSPGSWSAWQTVTLEAADRSAFSSVPRFSAQGGRSVQDIEVERLTALPAGVGAVDQLRWEQVGEVTDTNSTYAGYAMLALELIASEQLTGVPSVAADVEGQSQLRIWDGVSDPADPEWTLGYSDNPAWALLEVIANSTWGMGAQGGLSRIDTASLIAWAQVCDELVPRKLSAGTRRRYTFNLAVDSPRRGRELLTLIAAAGRARVSMSGQLFRVLGFAPQQAAAEMITDRDISASEEGVPGVVYTVEPTTGGVARTNQIVAQFIDAAQGGEVDEIRVPDYGDEWLATETPRPSTVRLDGVTDREQAYALAWHAMKRERYLGLRATIDVAMPVMTLQPGERFDLAESTAGFALATGGLLAATASTVTLDRAVTLDGAKAYRVSVVTGDGASQTRAVALAAGTFPAGTALVLAEELDPVPAAGDGYALGEVGEVSKPMLCESVELTDARDMLWRIEGVEYSPIIDDDDEAPAAVPNYSTLDLLDGAPGPLASLVAEDRSVGEDIRVLLSWRQSDADAQRTGSYRVYRRRVGTVTFVREPSAIVSRYSSLLDLDDSEIGYEFAVVAVSLAGNSLSPYDPRVPKATAVFNLGIPPPDAPATLTITREADGLYTLEAAEVDGAVEYQWLAGGDTTSAPNAGAEDCRVIARTPGPVLAGLLLPPGVGFRAFVRAVNPQGRLSIEAATAAVASPLIPPGGVSAAAATYDLSSAGTLSGLAWDAGQARLELSGGDEGTWTGPVVDLGAVISARVTAHAATANDAANAVMSTLTTLVVPSVEADQWGTLTDGGSALVGMIMPPWPDNAQAVDLECRSSNDNVTYSAWQPLTPYMGLAVVARYVQLRARLARTRAPYRPALRSVSLAVIQ